MRYRTLVLVMVLGSFIFHNCRHSSLAPFEIDTVSGTYEYAYRGQQLGPVHMVLNGSNALQGAFLFQEKDSLVYINSIGGLDIITRFAGDTAGGTLQIQVINAGKENYKVFQMDPLVITPTRNLNFKIINHREAVFVYKQDRSKTWNLKIMNDQPWDLRFLRKSDSLVLSLLYGEASVVLLPEENLRLPGLRFTQSSGHNPG